MVHFSIQRENFFTKYCSTKVSCHLGKSLEIIKRICIFCNWQEVASSTFYMHFSFPKNIGKKDQKYENHSCQIECSSIHCTLSENFAHYMQIRFASRSSSSVVRVAHFPAFELSLYSEKTETWGKFLFGRFVDKIVDLPLREYF